jgi:hypothetical protein
MLYPHGNMLGIYIDWIPSVLGYLMLSHLFGRLKW